MKTNGSQTLREKRLIDDYNAVRRTLLETSTELSISQVRVRDLEEAAAKPIPLILTCPAPTCGARHIDEGEWATRIHHTHSCQICGFTWRPAVVPTVGVRFLPGFKNP
jgi:hypothetical protein